MERIYLTAQTISFRRRSLTINPAALKKIKIMLLRSPLSSSLPFFSSRSTRSPAPCLCPILHHSISRSKEQKRECLVIVSRSISQVHSYGAMDFENKRNLHWSSLYHRILTAGREGKNASSVLESWDALEKRLTKWEVCRVAKELRKFGHINSALEVYEWMVAQGGRRFTTNSADMAIMLDLIGKVRGSEIAEQHFSNLSESFKDKRTYCSLLNIYAQHKLKEKAEATFDFARENGYITNTLPYNVMMTLYLDIHEHANVMKLIQEMKERNIKFDTYSYNIWISNSAAMRDLDQMESVLQVMESDNVNATWSIYTTLASKYIKFSLLDKAEVCLREAEKRITGRDRSAFLFFIPLYAKIGKREDIYRIWMWYRSSFSLLLNNGYKTMIQALLNVDDVAGAESVYEEWTKSGDSLDPRVCQVLMGWYCRNGLSDKASEALDRMVQQGGKPNQVSWVILGEGFLKENRLSEAMNCLEKAISCSMVIAGDKKWWPKPKFVEDLLELCKQREQSECFDQAVAILKRDGLDEIEPYQDFIQQYSLGGSG